MFDFRKQQSSGYYAQANSSYEEGKLEEALGSIDQAIIKWPHELEYYLLKMKILTSLGQNENAVKASNEALDIDSENLEIKSKKADLLYKLERFEEALSVYSQILEERPNDASLLYWKGSCLDRLGEKPAALLCYDQSIELNPHNYLVHYAKGALIHDQEGYKEATGEYQKAIELNQECHEAYYKLGLICSYFQKNEAALGVYQEAARLDPGNALYHNLCGHAAYSTGRKLTAFNFYTIALDLNPNDIAYWYNNAIVAFELQKEDDARLFYGKILEGRSKSIIDTLDKISKLPNALDVYLTSKPDTTISVEYVRNKAMALELLEEYDAALLMYNKAIAVDPDDSLTYHNQGKILYLFGKHKEAINCFNLALSLDISDLNSYLYNILSYYALDNDLEAQTLFPALNSFGQQDKIIDFLAYFSWLKNDPYIPKEARILLDLILFSKSYEEGFNLFLEKKINFTLKIAPENNTSLFVAILQIRNGCLIDQMLRTDQDFDEILRKLVLELDDSTSRSLIQKVSSKSDKIACSIKAGKIKLLELAVTNNKPQLAEYLLGLNIDLADQIKDRSTAAEFMIMVKNKELSCALQERFNFDLQEKLKCAILHDDIELVSNILIIAPELLEAWFDGMPLGHWVLKHSNADIMELILANDLSIESKIDNQSRNLLTVALMEQKFDIVELLIIKYNFGIGGPMYNMLRSTDSELIFNIPTLILQEALNHQSIGILLSHPNAAAIRDNKNNTALHIAVKYAHEEFIEDYLTDLSKMINEENQDGQTPLHLLLNEFRGSFAQIKILEQLLQMEDIDVEVPDKQGFTAIDIAANFAPYVLKRFYEKEVISREDLTDPTYSKYLPLLVKMPDIRSIRNTQEAVLKDAYPLHYACFQGNEQQVAHLLTHEENYNRPDIWGYFPLYYAVSQNNIGAVKLLASSDDVDIIRASNKPNRTTILHTAINEDDFAIIKCLFEKATDLEESISNLKGQFHRALIHEVQSVQTAAYLINLFKNLTRKNQTQYKLLDLNEQDVYGHTALYYASLLPDPKLMDYWFKLSLQHPKQYSINISLNQDLLCIAALKGNTAIISYLLERHGDEFSLDFPGNGTLVEISICGQGPRTIKFLFHNYPKSYLLVKDPARLKEIAVFFGNQELLKYLNEARLLSILSKHSELQLLEKIKEVEQKYQNKIQELENKYKEIMYVNENTLLGSRITGSFDGTRPFLGTIRKKLSDLQRGFASIQEQQLEHDEIMLLSGVDEKARIQKELKFFKDSNPKLHDYCTAFYYGLSTYIMAYKTLSTGSIQTSDDISNTAAKYGIHCIMKAGVAVSKGIPIVGSVVAFLDLVVIGTYSTIQSWKLQNKIQIVNEIIKKKSPLDDELSLNIVKTAVAVTKLKTQDIIQTQDQNKRLKWIEGKLKSIKENVIGEEIISTPSAALAMQDVGIILANMYKDYRRIINNDKPLDDILIAFALTTKPISSPLRRDEARRRSIFNLYNKQDDTDLMDYDIKAKFGQDTDKFLLGKDSMASFDSTDTAES